jgi:hypothetical protein
MTLIYRIGLGLFCFILLGCFSYDDDGFGRSVNLNIQDAFSLENQKEYSVGDTIFFELRFSRYLPEDGFPELLDIYQTTKSEDFAFSFGLEKFSELEDSFRQVNINEDFIIAEKKNLDIYYYNNNHGTFVALNTAKDSYEAKVGVILVEDGLFQFNFNNLFIESPFTDDGVQVGIYHRFSTDEVLDVEFEVTE